VELISTMTEMLVPLDGREASLRAVPVAGRIAKRLGLPLKLFGVSDDQEGTKEWLRSQADRLLPDSEVPVGVASGDPAEAIVSEAGSHTLVCMATAATLRPHQGHIGSVAEAVVRGVGRPVLLIGPHADIDPGQPSSRIVIPVDGSHLSEEALDVAGDLAQALGIEVWVVSVIPVGVEAAAEARLQVDLSTRESGYVRGLAGRLADKFGIATGFEVLHITDPADAILDFTGHDGIVVMSTHGRSGLSRLFAGSVAHGVVAGSHRPVVVCRPRDDD
jgi:nucleotide-binding universal stress UspA family protein